MFKSLAVIAGQQVVAIKKETDLWIFISFCTLTRKHFDMTRALLIGLSILLTLNSYSQSSNKKELKYKPKNLDEAIIQLDRVLHDTIKTQIYEMSENDFLSNAHMSTGLWIRNNWGLWKGKELAKYFNKLKIYHPDDMSGIILRCYYRHLHDRPYELENQITFYHDYWKKMEEHQYKMENDTAYVRQKEIENEKARIEYYNKIKEPFTSGTKVTAWVDYSIGLINGGRTQIEGLIVDWDDIDAIIEITKFRDESKEQKVRRYNKMTDNIIRVNIYQLDIWE